MKSLSKSKLTPAMQNFSSRNIMAIFVIFATGITIYFNSFGVPFIFDDISNVQNPTLKIDEISLNNLSEILSYSQLKTRPVSNISFALNYYFGGERVQGHHLFNIIVHIIAAISFFYLIQNTLILTKDTRILKCSIEISFFAAFLWLCHPLATQSVTYIVQRMNSMASMFYTLSMLFYVIARREPNNVDLSNRETLPRCFWYFLSVSMGLLAIGSKEIAATLPIAIFLYEWFFFQNLEALWIKRKIPILLLIFVAFITLALIYTGGNFSSVVFGGYNNRSFTLEQRLLTELRVIVHYMGLLVFPLPDRLSLDYSFPVSESFTQPFSTLWSCIILILMVMCACFIAKKERLLSYCIFFFFLNLLVESSFIPLEIIYEHRTYLPSMFAILLFVILFYRCTASRNIISILLLSLSMLFGYWTIQRNDTWNNPVIFWKQSLAKFPDNVRIHINLGVEYFKTGELVQAEEHFRAALKKDPQNSLIYNNLAEIEEKRGNYVEAEKMLNSAIQLNHKHVLSRINYASLLKKMGRFDESLHHYTFVHDLYPEYSIPNMEIGQLLLYAGKPKEALIYLNLALPRQSNQTSLIMAIAEANMRLRNTAESITYYQKALQQDPNLVVALFNLALIYTEIGKPALAEMCYQKAYLIQPQFIPITFNFGNFLLRNGEFKKAEEIYQAFLSQENMMADAHNNIGLAYLQMNMPLKALTQFEIALRINPTHRFAANNARLTRESLDKIGIIKQ